MATEKHIIQMTFILLYNGLIKQAYETLKNVERLLQIAVGLGISTVLQERERDLKSNTDLCKNPSSYTSQVFATPTTTD